MSSLGTCGHRPTPVLSSIPAQLWAGGEQRCARAWKMSCSPCSPDSPAPHCSCFPPAMSCWPGAVCNSLGEHRALGRADIPTQRPTVSTQLCFLAGKPHRSLSVLFLSVTSRCFALRRSQGGECREAAPILSREFKPPPHVVCMAGRKQQRLPQCCVPRGGAAPRPVAELAVLEQTGRAGCAAGS